MSNKKWKKTVTSPKFWARVLALFLTALMLLGAIVSVLPVFSVSSNAAEPFAYPLTADRTDLMVGVGLTYTSEVTPAFDVKANSGFAFGSVGNVKGENKYQYQELWLSGSTYIAIACDTNLTQTGSGGYAFSQTGDTVTVGGYHVQILCNSSDEAKAMLTEWHTLLDSSKGTYAFACYVNGKYGVRGGMYATEAKARELLAFLQEKGYRDLQLIKPSETAVTVINKNSPRYPILFEYDCADAHFGLKARQSGESESFLVTPADNTYRGIFQFTHYIDDDYNGIALTNVLPLEDYIKGVLPWEISASWPVEAQKTFALAARTFAVRSIMGPKHKTFDVCCTSCCQVYRGMKRTTQTVSDVVDATKGEILTYTQGTKTSVITSAYSSSMGGITNSNTGAWGSALLGYLSPVCTPWEKYQAVGNGSWTKEYTPAALQKKLAVRYPALKAPIKSVKITQYVENSTYVMEVVVTDEKGNTATVKGCDKIRSYFGLLSSHFVVGKAGESVTQYRYILKDRYAHTFFTGEEYPIPSETGEGFAVTDTGYGSYLINSQNPLYALDGNGEGVLLGDQFFALDGAGNTEEMNPSELYASYQPYSRDNLPDIQTICTDTVRIEETVELSGTAGNFVFSGSGWGHGVGLSAWGTRHLVDYGYTYDAVLKTYFQGAEIQSLRSVLGF